MKKTKPKRACKKNPINHFASEKSNNLESTKEMEDLYK